MDLLLLESVGVGQKEENQKMLPCMSGSRCWDCCRCRCWPRGQSVGNMQTSRLLTTGGCFNEADRRAFCLVDLNAAHSAQRTFKALLAKAGSVALNVNVYIPVDVLLILD